MDKPPGPRRAAPARRCLRTPTRPRRATTARATTTTNESLASSLKRLHVACATWYRLSWKPGCAAFVLREGQGVGHGFAVPHRQDDNRGTRRAFEAAVVANAGLALDDAESILLERLGHSSPCGKSFPFDVHGPVLERNLRDPSFEARPFVEHLREHVLFPRT